MLIADEKFCTLLDWLAQGRPSDATIMVQTTHILDYTPNAPLKERVGTGVSELGRLAYNIMTTYGLTPVSEKETTFREFVPVKYRQLDCYVQLVEPYFKVFTLLQVRQDKRYYDNLSRMA